MSWLRKQRQKLTTRFSTEQHLASAGRVSRLSCLHPKPLLRIGRDHCRYFCSDLSHVPKNKRGQALSNEVELKSPWDSTSFCVSWVGGVAQVWLWNHEQIQTLIAEQSLTPKTTCLSEVVFWSRRDQPGLYLLSVATGFDLQLWDKGVLVASQWFRQEPDKQQQQRFARSQGIVLNDFPLHHISDPGHDLPWPDTLRPVWEDWFERRSQLLVAVVAFSFLIASLQLTAIAQWYSIHRSAADEKSSLEVSANVLLTARNEARNLHFEVTDLLGLFSAPPPLAIQQRVYRQLPQELGLKLIKWERNFDRIDMTVEGQVTDTLGLVKALSGNGLTDVRVEPAREANRYRVQMRVAGAQEFLTGEASR